MIQVQLTEEQARYLKSFLNGEVNRLWERPGINRNDFIAMDQCDAQRYRVQELLDVFEEATSQ